MIHCKKYLARLAFQLASSKPYLAALYCVVCIRLVSQLGSRITAHDVNCQVFLPLSTLGQCT